MYNNGFQVTSENTLREFPLVIATVAKVSRKRGLWLVVRKKAAAFSDILSRKCCCFLFLQMISFSKRSAKSEFFLTHRFRIGSISVIPLSPANFCLQISRRCS